MGNMDALKQLMQQMMRGQPMSQEQMDQLGDMVGLPDANSPYQDSYYQRMMQRAMGCSSCRNSSTSCARSWKQWA